MTESESLRPETEAPGALPEARPPAAGRFGGLRVRLGAVAALAIAAGFIAWVASGGGGGTGGGPGASSGAAPALAGFPSGPVAVSSVGLETLAGAVPQPIYWVGSRGGALYELRRTNDGKVYLRYLPAGVRTGDPRPLLTVATYPMKDAFSATQALAQSSGSAQLQPGNGAVGFYNDTSQTDAYVAFPGSDFQIEVYSPTPGEARTLVEQGAVKKVAGGAVKTAARIVSARGLAAIARRLGEPIYWLGPEAGKSYELRQTSAGQIYVRYLPQGARAGATHPYVTIGTYPVAGAFRATKALGKTAAYTSVKVKGGAIAAYERANATSVYVAYPDSDLQVEVFAPVAGEAVKLVRAGRLAPIH